MRLLAALVALVFSFGVVAAQENAGPDPAPTGTVAKPKRSAKAKRKPAPVAVDAASDPAAVPAASKGLREAFMATPLAERVALQFDLIWSGDYNGVANGEFNDRMVAAVKAFQRRNGGKETGQLTASERAALAAAAQPLKDEAGWRIVQDAATGVRLGVPEGYATASGPAAAGTRWFSQQAQILIETFRLSGTTLDAAYEQQRAQRGRKVRYQVLRPDFFVVAGMQGLKRFYVRGAVRGDEVRGFSVAYDQAMEGEMEPVVLAMSSAFSPFEGAAAAAPQRNVEYATGVAVSGGHILTERQATDACRGLIVPGVGQAERIAEDVPSGLALLRIYGGRHAAPLPLPNVPTASGKPAALVGVADPQSQGGAAAVSRIPTQNSATGTLEAPPLGFAGAAVLDDTGRFVGTVTSAPTVVAGPTAVRQADVASLERVLAFLKANDVPLHPGSPAAEAVTAATVRVVCVRK